MSTSIVPVQAASQAIAARQASTQAMREHAARLAKSVDAIRATLDVVATNVAAGNLTGSKSIYAASLLHECRAALARYESENDADMRDQAHDALTALLGKLAAYEPSTVKTPAIGGNVKRTRDDAATNVARGIRALHTQVAKAPPRFIVPEQRASLADALKSEAKRRAARAAEASAVAKRLDEPKTRETPKTRKTRKTRKTAETASAGK